MAVVDELSGHFRDLMLYKTAPEAVDLLSALPDEYAEIERICGMYTLPEILRCLTAGAAMCGRNRKGKTAENCRGDVSGADVHGN